MFDSLKNTYNAAQFMTKMELAYKYPDDPRVPIKVGEAYDYFRKIRAADNDLIAWNSNSATKYAAWLTSISRGCPDPGTLSKISEMHEYFTGRSVNG